VVQKTSNLNQLNYNADATIEVEINAKVVSGVVEVFLNKIVKKEIRNVNVIG
jgi:hypothetical protein